MLKFGRYLRPVGDKIILKKKDFNNLLFHPYKIYFFQSGTAALSAAVSACIREKDIKNPEILLPAYACPDLISAVTFAGAKPILIDLQADTPWMSLVALKNHISKKTAAVITVNFLGIPEKTSDLKKTCIDNNLRLIEDSAQGLPLDHYNEYWDSDYIILSFGRGKPLNLLGGGAVLTNIINPAEHNLPSYIPEKNTLIENIKYIIKITIYNFMINPYIYNLIVRIPWLNIGATIFKPLKNISPISETRILRIQRNYEKYKKLNHSGDLIQKHLNTINNKDIIDLASLYNKPKSLLRYPILIKDNELKNQFVRKFKDKGISEMYKVELSKISGIDKHVNIGIAHPNACSFSRSLVTIPVHEDFHESDIIEIVEFLKSKYSF